MTSLGEFGAAMKELDRTAPRDSFTFFGERFDVVSEIPPMLMLQLGAAATGKIDDAEGFAAMWEALRVSLTEPALTKPDGEDVPEDASAFNQLYKLAVGRRAGLDGLMRLVFKLFEAQGGRPTAAAPDSSGGPPATSPSSKSSSSGPSVLVPQPLTEQQIRDQDDRAHLVPVRDLLTG